MPIPIVELEHQHETNAELVILRHERAVAKVRLVDHGELAVYRAVQNQDLVVALRHVAIDQGQVQRAIQEGRAIDSQAVGGVLGAGAACAMPFAALSCLAQ